MKIALSDIIGQVFNPARGMTTYGNLVDEVGRHGMAVILILFSLPAALPIPAAGYSTVLSIPLFIIGFRLLLGYQTLWLPARIRDRQFDPAGFSRRLLDWMTRLTLFVENFTRPRLSALTRSGVVRVVIAVLIIALATSMALPIPGTNTAPAFGIFLIGFALLEEDGLLLIVGLIASLIALAISVTIIFFGYQALMYVKDVLKAFVMG